MASRGYDARNTRAREAGWSSYGAQRRARELGYLTPAEYANARAAAGREATPANPAVPVRAVPGGGVVRRTGAVTGISGPWSILPRLQRELGRFRRDDARVTVYVGGKTFARRGYSLGFIRDGIREHGSLQAFLEHQAATVGTTDSEPGAEVGGDVSIVVGP